MTRRDLSNRLPARELVPVGHTRRKARLNRKFNNDDDAASMGDVREFWKKWFVGLGAVLLKLMLLEKHWATLDGH